LGFEFKYTDKPKITPSMLSAIETLNLKKLFIVTPLQGSYDLNDKITVASVGQIAQFIR
jgi:hypothetical protein